MTSPKPQNLYGQSYYKNYCGPVSYDRSENWLSFFGNIAEKIVRDFNPKSVLDAGCAIGILVEILSRYRLDVYGFDISEWAIQQMPEEYAPLVTVGSILDANVVDRHFDVVVCIEVLEHLQPDEAETAIHNLCKWGDIIIFSSSPDDYAEATHFNVQQPGYWAEKFAQQGFARFLDYDATYIAPWAQVYRREKIVPSASIRQYENLIWQRSKENVSLRDLVIKLQQEAGDIAWYNEEFQRLAQELDTRDRQLIAFSEEKQNQSPVINDFRGYAETSENRIKQLDSQLVEERQQHLTESNEIRRIALHHESRVHELETTLRTIQATKGWNYLNRWWRLKRLLLLATPRRQRLQQLTAAAQLTLRHDGPIELVKRSVRWLGGERRMYRPQTVRFAELPTVAGSTPHTTDPFADYEKWIEETEPDALELGQQSVKADSFHLKPIISVITPVFNTDEHMLVEMIESVCAQTYPYWELCLLDGGSDQAHVWKILQDYGRLDSRIKVRRLEQNLGISGNSNAALELAAGDYVALLDHDDVIAPFALFAVAAALNETPSLDFIYSDKDLITEDGRRRFHPFLKPDWSPEILLNTNYLTHLCVIRKSLVDDIGGFDLQANGAQDWALFLDVALRTDRVLHIPQVLYHWRQHPMSVATGTIDVKPYAAEAQLYSIQRYLNARHLKGNPDFAEGSLIRIFWTPNNTLSVTVVLDVTVGPSVTEIESTVRKYLYRSPYDHIEVIILNRTGDATLFQNSTFLSRHPEVQVLPFDVSTPRGAVRNSAIQKSTGSTVVFLNADLIPDNDDHLQELVGWAQHPEVGAVTGCLMQPDGTIAHAGYILNMNGVAGSIGPTYHKYSETLYGLFIWYRNLSAVSGDCLAVRREHLSQVGYFNETFEAAGSDIDLCLRLRQAGLRHVYTPFASFHYTQPVNTAWTGTKQDLQLLYGQFGDLLDQGDPYYNVHLSTDSVVPRFRLQRASQDSATIPQSHYSGTWAAYSAEADYLAHYYDFDLATLEKNNALHRHFTQEIDISSVTWFIPGFVNAFYGGIRTVLQFAEYFQKAHGVRNHFVVLNGDASVVEKAIKSAFPDLRDATVRAILSVNDVKHLKATDVGICTFWTTAYALLRYNQTKRKFYFLQDMEPLFYPAGTTSGLIESSYGFGFYGLINTPGLKIIYDRDYQGRSEAFTPAIDTKVFFPPHTPNLDAPPYRVFFYGRPGHPRNAFELGATALRALKKRFGSDVEIIAAGSEWNPADYDLSGVVENYGLLSYEGTGELYRSCHAGLILMLTRHPSYLPLELMACHSLVVTNFNAYTSWLLKNQTNCLLCSPSATSIVETLELGLRDTALRSRITDNAAKMVLQERSDWIPEMEKIYNFMRLGKL